MNIQPLDTKVVKQLKASIIITSLEQCLEELVKNALDAGATSIDVKADTDRCMIQVTDNGMGILPSDFPQLAQRHVTSKCHSLTELHGIRTFGYRGEALASLATMSILHITSTHQSDMGTYSAIWKDGRLIQYIKSKDKLQPGTTVSIPSLFYKFPVRQKHQTTNIDTLKHTLTLFALIFPQVDFTLTDIIRNSKCMVTKKCSSSFGVFQSLFGARFAQAIKAYSIHEDQFRLQGFFGAGVPTKVHQYIYVNQHHIPPSYDIYKIVTSAIQNYTERLAEEQMRKGKDHPLFLIKIDCTSLASYDIPFLSEHGSYPQLTALLERLVLQYIRSTGKCKLQQQHHQQQLNNESSSPLKRTFHLLSPSASSSKKSKLHLEHRRSLSNRILPPWNGNTRQQQHGKTSFNDYPSLPYQAVNSIDRSHLRRHPDKILDLKPIIRFPTLSSSSSSSSPTPNSTVASSLSSSPLSLSTPSIASTTQSSLVSASSSSSSVSSSYTLNSSYGLQAPRKLQRQDLATAKVLAQVDRKWIVCLLDQMLLLIDQHAADERIKLELMLASDLDVRLLQPSLIINTLTEHEMNLATKYRSALQRWGIHVEKKALGSDGDGTASPHFVTRYQSSPHFNRSNNKSKRPIHQLIVSRLPQLIIERCILDPQVLTDLLHGYLHDLEAQMISTSACPAGMMDMLKSKACRGAIMFNDPLTIDQCTSVIKSLAKCRFPFQCAHGRPSVIPLSNLGKQKHRRSRPIRWDAFVE